MNSVAADSVLPAAPPAATTTGRLRLRKLVLNGFKSFADETEFVFDRPIVGVVGPNGCGKSNVVDALKWVLGEQSAKSLRGGAMLDVIFNGSGNRPAGTSAEVTLHFDNLGDASSRPLPVDADEVTVGRVLLRDGTSHYKLNGRNARLKDVRELFLDTGIGVDAYSIIEQGRVAQMLDANPAERRLIFEEAAGISRFKQQKKEAQRKLERVDANLLRLGDVFDEVAKQVRSLKLAAGKARSYQELTTRLSELRRRAAVHEYHALVTRRQERTTEREAAAFEADDAAGELRSAESRLADLRQQAERAEEARRQSEVGLVQIEGRIERAAQRIDYAHQQAEQLRGQEAQLAIDRADAQRQLSELAAAVEEDERSLTDATEELEKARGEIEARHAAHRDAQLAQAKHAESAEQSKAALLRSMNALAAADRRLGALEIEQKAAADRLDVLASRAAQLRDAVGSARSTVTALDARVAELAETREVAQAALDAKRREAVSLGDKLSGLGERLAEAREQRSGLASRRKVLTDLEVRREGLGEGVKQILRERDGTFSFVRGLVADLLRVDVEHAAVVEAALDGRDQWLVVDAGALPAAALEHQAALRDLPSRVTLVASTDTASQLPADGERASDLVQSDPEHRPLIERLLGATRVVDSLASVVAGQRCVTRDGDLVEADGTLRIGPAGAGSGLVSRRSELAEVSHQMEELDAAIDRLRGEVAQGSSDSKQIERDVNATRERVYEVNAQQVEAAEKRSAHQDRLATFQRELPSVEQEAREVTERRESLEAERDQQDVARQKAADERDAAEASQQSLAAEANTVAGQIAQAAEALTATRVALGQIQEQQIAARRAVDRHAARRRELRQQIERLDTAAATLDERRDAITDEAAVAESEKTHLEQEREELIARVAELAAKVRALRSEAADGADRVDAIQHRKADAEDRVRAADAALAELAVRLETAVARAAEEAELDVVAAHAEVSEGGYEEPDEDWDAVANEVRDLRARISRLGSVNVDAIGELEQLQGRESTLGEQLDDLRTSKKQLGELIDSLNVESSERFEQTFNAVREHFSLMFRKLFGGGRADLYLQTEVVEKRRDDEGNVSQVTRTVDPLDAGIDIVARPPGKQPVSISQLSGGEKTMTCVALLMSIFKSKPSPFCVLDEVDAALDEANNARFNRILEEFLGESQFIVITHSKRTMRAADVLYGVTMQDQGVSKKVEVRFDPLQRNGLTEREGGHE